MKKIINILFLSLILFVLGTFNISNVDAYVSVKGYYKSNGTYVAPHVRSNPNGVKYDNYGYTPSQGLYNPSYGTRGTYWDTPTYITDPDYYEGKAIYDSGASIPATNKNNSDYLTVPGGYKMYGSLYCNTGYYKKNNLCNSAPINSVAYGQEDFYCNSGYVKSSDNRSCIPNISQDQLCKSSFGLNSITSGDNLCACANGYEWTSDRKSCTPSLVCAGDFLKQNNVCVSFDQACQDTYGINSIGIPGSKNVADETASCLCDIGYQWDANRTTCEVKPVIKSIDRNLKIYYFGDDVGLLQNLLKKEGLYSFDVSNTFDVKTQNAVIAFQKKYSIKPAVGFVGPITRGKINDLLLK